MSDTIATRIQELGLTLPTPANPVANYIPYLLTNDLLFISGQLSKTGDEQSITGCLGDNVEINDGINAARLCALNILAQAKAALGSLERIKHVVRLNGFVCATPHFTAHPQIINGASDLMVEVFGNAGRHTRAAVGVSSLPAGCAVEIDAIFSVTGD